MKIVDRMPYFTRRTEVPVRGENVAVKPYQIIVWVSVGEAGELEWDPRTPLFPAVFDPGHNHNFGIFPSQLLRWAGIAPDALPLRGAVREGGTRMPLHSATVWLHRNKRGTRDVRGEPYPMILEEGISLYPNEGEKAAHLPLLGLRALTDNNLVSTIDGDNQWVTIRTSRRWWWPFG
jgi:hypothetical protein